MCTMSHPRPISFSHPNYNPSTSSNPLHISIIHEIFSYDERLIESPSTLSENVRYELELRKEGSKGNIASESDPKQHLAQCQEKLLYLQLYLKESPVLFFPFLQILAEYHEFAPSYHFYAHCLEHGIGARPNTVRALKYYAQSMQRYHDSASLLALGRIEWGRRNVEKAKEYFTRGKEKNSCCKCHFQLIALEMDENRDFENAMQLLNEFMQILSESVAQLLASEENRSSTSFEITQTMLDDRLERCTNSLLCDAQELIKEEQFAKALPLLELIEPHDCIRYKALWVMAYIHMRGFDTVLPNMERALHLYKQSVNSAMTDKRRTMEMIGMMDEKSSFFSNIQPSGALQRELRVSTFRLLEVGYEYDQRNTRIMILLAQRYKDGHGTLPNVVKALELLESAKDIERTDELDLSVRTIRHEQRKRRVVIGAPSSPGSRSGHSRNDDQNNGTPSSDASSPLSRGATPQSPCDESFSSVYSPIRTIRCLSPVSLVSRGASPSSQSRGSPLSPGSSPQKKSIFRSVRAFTESRTQRQRPFSAVISSGDNQHRLREGVVLQDFEAKMLSVASPSNRTEVKQE